MCRVSLEAAGNAATIPPSCSRLVPHDTLLSIVRWLKLNCHVWDTRGRRASCRRRAACGGIRNLDIFKTAVSLDRWRSEGKIMFPKINDSFSFEKQAIFFTPPGTAPTPPTYRPPFFVIKQMTVGCLNIGHAVSVRLFLCTLLSYLPSHVFL